MISRTLLDKYYIRERRSVSEISRMCKVSQGSINYWLAKYSIKKRSIRDAVYQKWNPNGDPFKIKPPNSLEEAFLYGLGVGLYWGEGTKRSKTSVRIGNSDPRLLRMFIEFLVVCYRIDKKRLRCGLQVFGDMNKAAVERFWMKELGFPKSHFYKTIVTPYRGVGNYRHKTKNGVATIYFNNRKLRDILCDVIGQLPMRKPR